MQKNHFFVTEKSQKIWNSHLNHLNPLVNPLDPYIFGTFFPNIWGVRAMQPSHA